MYPVASTCGHFNILLLIGFPLGEEQSKCVPGAAVCQHPDHVQEQQYHRHEVHEQWNIFP